MSITALSHIALFVKDIDAMIDFYTNFANMEVIHNRVDNGTHVAWLRLTDVKSIMIVMIEDKNIELSKYKTLNHFGFDVSSREDVDRIANKAQELGILAYPAMDGGKIIGYLCMIKDPDGNFVEFSYGQMHID